MQKYLLIIPFAFFYVLNAAATDLSVPVINCPANFPQNPVKGVSDFPDFGVYKVLLNYTDNNSGIESMVIMAQDQEDAAIWAKFIMSSHLTATSKHPVKGASTYYCTYASTKYKLCTSPNKVESGSCQSAYIKY